MGIGPRYRSRSFSPAEVAQMSDRISHAFRPPTPEHLLEELANAISHGVGLALSVLGFGVLMYLACVYGDAWHITSCAIYGISLVSLYTASTLYHSTHNPKVKPLLRRLDHIGIFLLIAGTYTPFTLTVLRNTMTGWVLFAVVWGIAVLGILMKIFMMNKLENFSTVLYLLMGWSVVFAIKPMWDNMPGGGFALLVAGGLTYTAGVLFYVMDHRRFFHMVWHIFVLVASACHYFAVYYYVLPQARS